MVCDFIGCLATISLDVEMSHNNIRGTIEEMQSKVDIENEKEQYNTFEKVFGLQILMPLDNGIMVVHTRSNPFIFKHGKIGTKLGQECDYTPLSDIQSWNLANEFDLHDLLTFAKFPIGMIYFSNMLS
jgi:hypothetical protein